MTSSVVLKSKTRLQKTSQKEQLSAKTYPEQHKIFTQSFRSLAAYNAVY
jgi:hypothetical protein